MIIIMSVVSCSLPGDAAGNPGLTSLRHALHGVIRYTDLLMISMLKYMLQQLIRALPFIFVFYYYFFHGGALKDFVAVAVEDCCGGRDGGIS